MFGSIKSLGPTGGPPGAFGDTSGHVGDSSWVDATGVGGQTDAVNNPHSFTGEDIQVL